MLSSYRSCKASRSKHPPTDHWDQRARPAADSVRIPGQAFNFHDLDSFTRNQQDKFKSMLKTRTKLLVAHQRLIKLTIQRAFATVHLQFPQKGPASVVIDGMVRHLIDRNKQHIYSEFLRRTRWIYQRLFPCYEESPILIHDRTKHHALPHIYDFGMNLRTAGSGQRSSNMVFVQCG